MASGWEVDGAWMPADGEGREKVTLLLTCWRTGRPIAIEPANIIAAYSDGITAFDGTLVRLAVDDRWHRVRVAWPDWLAALAAHGTPPTLLTLCERGGRPRQLNTDYLVSARPSRHGLTLAKLVGESRFRCYRLAWNRWLELPADRIAVGDMKPRRQPGRSTGPLNGSARRRSRDPADTAAARLGNPNPR